jgi:hypothetical protein
MGGCEARKTAVPRSLPCPHAVHAESFKLTVPEDEYRVAAIGPVAS